METPASGVFFSHGFRHTWEYEAQSALLRRAYDARHPMVRGPNATRRMVLFNDHPNRTRAQVDAYAARYSFLNVTVLRPGLWQRGGVWGRNCGHLKALAYARALLTSASFVLFAHPDVMLYPRALDALWWQLRAFPDAGLFVNAFSRPQAYKTDLFLYRPRRLGPRAFHADMCQPWPMLPEESLFRHAEQLGAPTVVMRTPDGSEALHSYAVPHDAVQRGGWAHQHRRAKTNVPY